MSNIKVPNDVLNVLSNAKCEGNSVQLLGQLDRKLYTAVNKVLEQLGGKWSRKAAAHIFEGDAETALEQAILTGEIAAPQKLGYFPTPRVLANKMVEVAGIAHRHIVLEPSAGIGNIVDAIAYNSVLTTIHCYELQEDKAKKIIEKGNAHMVCVADFLKVEPTQSYDRVLMNPPFEKQADIHHVLHALKFLKPDGVLVAIMSASITFRDNALTKMFNQVVREHKGIIAEIPDGSFKESGTMVKTVMVTLFNQG